MIEGEVDAEKLGAGEPSRLRGVVATAERPADGLRLVENAHRMSARIAFRIRIHAEKLADPHLDAGFLEGLTRARLLRRLSPLAEPTRKRPAAPEGLAATPHEDNPSA